MTPSVCVDQMLNQRRNHQRPCTGTGNDDRKRGAEPALREAHAAGLGVVIKEAVANGRLAGPIDDAGLTKHLQPLHDAAVRRGTTPDAIAIAAALAQPWVDVVLSGAATIAHLESNLTAPALGWDSSLDRELESLAMSSADYWRVRRSFAWN